MEKHIEEIVRFFNGAGFTITPCGVDRWHVRFEAPDTPGKAIDEEQSSDQLRAFYQSVEQSYAAFLKEREEG